MPSGDAEDCTETEPAALVQALAERKARDVLPAAPEDALVIGADTVVALDDVILGKPRDAEDAAAMLRALSGRTHQVYTGVCVIGKDGAADVFTECTDVTFQTLSEEEIAAYVASGEPMDKAGAYGIQGPFCRHVESIRGDYCNVVGLPVAHLYRVLRARLAQETGERS